MEKHYIVQVNAAHEFEISVEEAQQVNLSDNHVIHCNNSYRIEWLACDYYQKKYVLTLNGSRHEVQITDDLDLLILSLGLSVKASQNKSDILAPMPGRIIKAEVSVGQKVKKGDALITLEAMKMENTLQAQNDGVIKAVHIREGDTVAKKQLLVEFE